MAEQQEFEYDVFLSHANADKAAVRELAERLKGDGLRVWLDEWVIQPGDSIPLAIEQGLESSRTLVLVMSQAAFDSEWVTLERHTALFRDPTNQQRRFIPLRLDDCEIPGTLEQFAYLDWQATTREEYSRLLFCLRSSERTVIEKPRKKRTRTLQRYEVLTGHGYGITSVEVTPDGELVIFALENGRIHVHDTQSGIDRFVWKHEDSVVSVNVTHDGLHLLSASTDHTIRLWNLESGRCVRTIDHTEFPNQVAVSGNGRYGALASPGNSTPVWDLESGECVHRLTESFVSLHRNAGEEVYAVAMTTDGSRAITSSNDNRLRVWDVRAARCIQSLASNKIGDAALAADGKKAATIAVSTIEIWDIEKEKRKAVLEGHTKQINCLSMTADGRRIVSGANDHAVRIWDAKTGECIVVLKGHEHPVEYVAIDGSGKKVVSAAGTKVFVWEIPDKAHRTKKEVTARYTNAKVIFVGDSGVGKTGLAIRLAESCFQETASSDAHWATQLRLPNKGRSRKVDREIWLWDFAGQADYRLIHQLFMDEAALAALVFNPQSENPFEGLGQWDRDIARAARRKLGKLLVAGRCDRGGLTVSRESIEQFAKQRGYQRFLQTSAKTGEGCNELREALERSIDWDSIPWTASPKIFKLLKEEIIRLSDEGFTLLRMSELKQQLEMRLPDDPFTYEELKAVVGLLAGPGHVWQLEFGQFVLLHPERINSYAAAVGRTVRSHLQQIGVIHESAMLAGQLNFGDVQRLPPREEAIVLRAMHQTLVDHGFCLTQETDAGPLLVFPSYFNRERRDQIDHPRIFGTFRFSGALEELYATLVVKLHHTRTFETEELWRYAADFAVDGGKVGLKMRKLGEGDAELIVYCDPEITIESKVSFIRYIHDHLKRYDTTVQLVRHYVCRNPECEEAVSDVKAILRAREKGLTQLPCQYCFEPIPMWDELEQELASEKYEARVREMEATSRAGIDRESRNLQVEYHAFAIAEETNQQFVPANNNQLGTQARIELLDLSGQPSDKCLYLQLSPNDVFFARSANLDGESTFHVREKDIAEQWASSESPVMLVHRTADGYIQWMNVTERLKKDDKRNDVVTEFTFEGEPFTALNLQRLRDRLLDNLKT